MVFDCFIVLGISGFKTSYMKEFPAREDHPGKSKEALKNLGFSYMNVTFRVPFRFVSLYGLIVIVKWSSATLMILYKGINGVSRRPQPSHICDLLIRNFIFLKKETSFFLVTTHTFIMEYFFCIYGVRFRLAGLIGELWSLVPRDRWRHKELSG